MRVEQVAFPVIRQIAKRTRLAKVVFGLVGTENPFDPGFYIDPYPRVNKLWEKGPVFYHRIFGQWMVIGYDEVHELLRSSDTAVSDTVEVLLSVRPYSSLSDQAKSSFSNWVLVNDPPDHTRLRALVSRAFTPKRIASWEPRITNVANELVAAMGDAGEPDVVKNFTTKLPIYVIGDILGLPRDRWDWLKEASDSIAGLLDPFLEFDPVAMNRHFADLHVYFLSIAAARRAEPRDDVISALVQAVDGDALTDEELVAMIQILMIAGHETTTGMLGNAIVALAAHPDQRELFRTRPDLRENAIEELIRFDSSVTSGVRVATKEVQLGDKTIKAGARVAILWGAANRDPRRWPDANELHLDRANPRSVSFGHGIHHCLGAALARMEMRIGLGAFIDAFGDYTIDTSRVEWKKSGALRGPIVLPVRRATDSARSR
jgi:cytochrome P450